MRRRTWLASGLLAGLGTRLAESHRVEPRPDAQAEGGAADAALRFPIDFGAHPRQRTEWWYATGSLDAGPRRFGFQITFFRAATPVAADHPSRFAASQIVFAHAALTDLEQRRLRHDEAIARSGFGVAEAATGETRVKLHGWTLSRSGAVDRSRYAVHVPEGAERFGFDLQLEATQPLLLQGLAGVSRKGPRPEQVSRYYSQPQLAVSGALMLDDRRLAVEGKAWFDHEWSDAYLAAEAVGWDWIGMNLDDGSALMAFRIRRRDGTTYYAGGSFRRPGQPARNFEPAEIQFVAGRRWSSTASKASYPVEWTVSTPVGRYAVRALLDDQELDSRRSTGAIYWEGLSELLNDAGRRIGRGYLEMTGYAGALAM
ncbi:MAG: lipocalin-like domain-containing protein [Rhizobacter sp.]